MLKNYSYICGANGGETVYNAIQKRDKKDKGNWF